MKKHDEPDGLLPEYDFSDARRGRYAGRFFVAPGTAVGTTVVLRRDVSEHGLREGDAGRISAPYQEPNGFEVEFAFGSSEATVNVLLAPGDLRFLRDDEVLHVRATRAG
jgi:hypothetical protein